MHYINRFTCRSPHKIRNVTKFLFLPRKKTLSLTLLFSYFCFLVFCTLCLIFLWNFYKRWKMSDKISGNFRQFFCFCCKKIKIVIKYLKATILYKMLCIKKQSVNLSQAARSSSWIHYKRLSRIRNRNRKNRNLWNTLQGVSGRSGGMDEGIRLRQDGNAYPPDP